MTTSAKTLWQTLNQILSADQLMPLQHIYSEIAARLTFDEGDLLPEVGNAKQRAWQRNVRNVLGQHARNGEIEHNNAKYRLREMGTGWSTSEIDAIISDYFNMLLFEQEGLTYNKAEHRRNLIAQLRGRSEQSLEFKYCNISAVLAEIGLPYIEGYKPRTHYQQALRDAVLQQLQENRKVTAGLRDTALAPPLQIPVADPVTSFIPAPTSAVSPDFANFTPRGRFLDYAAIEARNTSLGTAGEKWVVELERSRLIKLGRLDLADKIEWVSHSQGDGLGYDIASYEPSGKPIFIEVKTTSGGPEMPFLITSRELEQSHHIGPAFRLYRVFRFKTMPRVFILSGDLSSQLNLKPKLFYANVSKTNENIESDVAAPVE